MAPTRVPSVAGHCVVWSARRWLYTILNVDSQGIGLLSVLSEAGGTSFFLPMVVGDTIQGMKNNFGYSLTSPGLHFVAAELA